MDHFLVGIGIKLISLAEKLLKFNISGNFIDIRFDANWGNTQQLKLTN